MMWSLLFCLMAPFIVAADWAVIVAGSSTYGNYRHQADACHAYQIVHQWGIKDDNIIMMYEDDIANNSQNPFPGKIFNAPTSRGTPGKDVYHGCKKDYTARQVTPENFISVLTGDNSTGLPVLQSTQDDRVFVNFVDHGGPGLIAFPRSTLSATKLNNAINTMHYKKMFKKLVFYMEACESGSMFEKIIRPDINVYVTTAADASESSWGTYCPPNDIVDGTPMNTCLGDLYSVSWMANCEKVGPRESLEEQFNRVKKLTNQSHVMQYGDASWTSDSIGDFMGRARANKPDKSDKDAAVTDNDAGIVSSRDIPMHLAYYTYLRTEQYEVQARRKAGLKLRDQIDSRLRADGIFHTFATTFGTPALMSTPPKTPVLCGQCCEVINEAYQNHCGGYDDYSMQYLRTVHNVCMKPTIKENVEQYIAIASKLANICQGIDTQFK